MVVVAMTCKIDTLLILDFLTPAQIDRLEHGYCDVKDGQLGKAGHCKCKPCHGSVHVKLLSGLEARLHY